MSTQDIRKLSSVIRSIEIIEEKTNILHSQFTTSLNDNDGKQPPIIDDSNIHLQLFFQHLEQLLEIDFKNRSFLLNNTNKKSYWNFFILALKESKGLYDTVLHVTNSQEVKTNTGRGRLFLRFCLQTHRLGDVIQQSFMMTKIVNQFYVDECFWTSPTYLNRVIQALYQLNDLQFDLLNSSQYQLDISWPTIESTEIRPTSTSNDSLRMRNESTSSLLSMNSVDSQSIVSVVPDISDSVHATPTFANFDASTYDDNSLCSTEENPENTLDFWKEKCYHLEIQLQDIESNHVTLPLHDIEIQCSFDDPENQRLKQEISFLDEQKINLTNEIDQLKEQNEKSTSEIKLFQDNFEQIKLERDRLNEENEQLRNEINVLKEDMNNLSFQLSSISMQRSTSSDKIKEFEHEIAQYQIIIQEKEALLNQLQIKYDQQIVRLQSIDDEHSSQINIQNQRIVLLENELDKMKKSTENERMTWENERKELNQTQEKLEAALHEKTLDFEEMKRRLLKAIREKAELFETIHNYEVKLEVEQSKKWIADEDVDNCTKCNVGFGWTVRKHHCRHCQKIFCHQCSNNWLPGQKANSAQYRICDYCNEKLSKDTNASRTDKLNNHGIDENVDLGFEVRPERLTQSTT